MYKRTLPFKYSRSTLSLIYALMETIRKTVYCTNPIDHIKDNSLAMSFLEVAKNRSRKVKNMTTKWCTFCQSVKHWGNVEHSHAALPLSTVKKCSKICLWPILQVYGPKFDWSLFMLNFWFHTEYTDKHPEVKSIILKRYIMSRMMTRF